MHNYNSINRRVSFWRTALISSSSKHHKLYSYHNSARCWAYREKAIMKKVRCFITCWNPDRVTRVYKCKFLSNFCLPVTQHVTVLGFNQKHKFSLPKITGESTIKINQFVTYKIANNFIDDKLIINETLKWMNIHWLIINFVKNYLCDYTYDD